MRTFFAAALFALVSGTSALAHDWQYHYATEVPYRVVNVANWDVLNMRAGPSASHRIVGALAPGEGGVYIRACARHASWCLVHADSRSGWVNMRYLAGYAH